MKTLRLAFTKRVDAIDLSIKQIVSRGHASPEGFWYDQDQREWAMVLKGAARLRRVEWTTPVELTLTCGTQGQT